MELPDYPFNRLRGRSLRFVLVAEMRRREVMTVVEMAEFLAHQGYVVAGRPSKEISDSLRWEVARGRVKRLSRGVYAYRAAPPSTARRIQIFAMRCRAWLEANARGEEPQPTPPTRVDRRFPLYQAEDPRRPPWDDFGWLWTT